MGSELKYKCLKRDFYFNGSYSIKALELSDMESIRLWRNEQMDVLRQQRKITSEEQSEYYSKYIEPGFSADLPSQMLFGLHYGDKLIGYGGLTNIDWSSKRAEISFLLNPQRVENKNNYKEDFSVFLRLIKGASFNDLKLHRLFTETYDIRPYHVEVLENEGFTYEGRMRDHVKIDQRYVDSLIHGIVN